MIHSTSGNTTASPAPPPSSVPPPLTDSTKFYQTSLHFATLPEQISAKFQFLQVLLQKKSTGLLTAHNWFSVILQIHSSQGSFSILHGWEFSTFPSGANTPCQSRAKEQPLLVNLMPMCPVLPQNPKHCHCCTISVYFFGIAVLGCGRSFSKGPVVMDISHQEQQFRCCSLWAN